MISSIDLSRARVLITNDDGIDAEGLAVLEGIVRPLVGELWVIAPSEGHSGASAMVSLRREVELLARGERRYAVTGRPADSVQAALRILMTEAPPDLVLSGINHGLNIGGDLLYSGTVGAAMCAAVNGIPSIALSADHESGQPVEPETWTDVRAHLPTVLTRICRFGFASGGAYGVNFPKRIADPEPQVCHQGLSRDGFYYHPVPGSDSRYILHHGNPEGSWFPATDSGAIANGRIAVTPLTLDRTDWDLLHRATEAL